MEETKIDKLRNELIALRKEREAITFEKGLAAEDNKDLRENCTYDYWFEKEIVANARIALLIKMIGDLSKKDKPKKELKKRKIEKVRGTFEPHKWL